MWRIIKLKKLEYESTVKITQFLGRQLLRKSLKIHYLTSLHVFPLIYLKFSLLNKSLLSGQPSEMKCSFLPALFNYFFSSFTSFLAHAVFNIPAFVTVVSHCLFWNPPLWDKSSDLLFLLSNDHNKLLTSFAHNLIFSVIDCVNLFLSLANWLESYSLKACENLAGFASSCWSCSVKLPAFCILFITGQASCLNLVYLREQNTFSLYFCKCTNFRLI